jgi:hypothetical protein
VALGFSLPTREAVDRLSAELTGSGYRGKQPPYDAFWGARYAVVADPDGIDVGLMSPIDQQHRRLAASRVADALGAVVCRVTGACSRQARPARPVHRLDRGAVPAFPGTDGTDRTVACGSMVPWIG